jgi:hypothetical protein
MANGWVVLLDGAAGFGVVVGRWSRMDSTGVETRGMVVLPWGGHEDVSLTSRKAGDVGAVSTRTGWVFPSDVGDRLRRICTACDIPVSLVPRVLVHRSCCGYDWMATPTREEFMESRLNGRCVAFHTPNHDLHMDQMFNPDKLVAEAEADWQEVVGILGGTDGAMVEGS